MLERGSRGGWVQPSARRRRCCPEILWREICRSPGRRDPRRKLTPANRAAGSARVRRTSSCGSPPRTRGAVVGMRSFDETSLEFQLLPQPDFLTGHLTMVVLVIVARQMKDAMQRQNFNLVLHSVAQAPGIVACDVGGDRYLSGNAPRLAAVLRQRWKRQDVRGLICSAKSLVQKA